MFTNQNTIISYFCGGISVVEFQIKKQEKVARNQIHKSLDSDALVKSCDSLKIKKCQNWFHNFFLKIGTALTRRSVESLDSCLDVYTSSFDQINSQLYTRFYLNLEF